MQIFTNSALHVNQTKQTIYTCLANEDASIHNLMITNNSVIDTVKINLCLEKNNDSFYCIPKDFSLGATNTLELKPINLSPGDKLTIVGDKDDIIDIVASILREVRDF